MVHKPAIDERRQTNLRESRPCESRNGDKQDFGLVFVALCATQIRYLPSYSIVHDHEPSHRAAKGPRGRLCGTLLRIAPALSQGETEEEAEANIRDAFLTVLDMMREQGDATPISPAEVRELVVA